MPPPAASWIYELTEWGSRLKPVLLSLGAWAVRSPSLPRDTPVSMDSVILGLSTFFDADAAENLSARYELRLGDNTFHVRVADGTLDVGREPGGDPDAIIDTDVDTLRELIWNGRELADALGAGEITIDGDQHAVARFLELFPQP